MNAELYAHVVWDWNGTLLDDVTACLAAINRLLEAHGRKGLDRTTYRDVFGFPIRAYYESLGFDFEVQDWDTLAREFHGYYAETSRDAPLHDGILDMLVTLREQGVGLSVLSASETGLLNRMMEAREVQDYFDFIRGISDLYGDSKLNAGLRHMDELTLPGDRVVLIGDTTHDFEVAQEMACDCILLGCGHQSPHRLTACGCPVVPTVRDLVPLLTGRACLR
jgi:phosphoglycolate phosphatase